jgi:hypothetical protein
MTETRGDNFFPTIKSGADLDHGRDQDHGNKHQCPVTRTDNQAPEQLKTDSTVNRRSTVGDCALSRVPAARTLFIRPPANQADKEPSPSRPSRRLVFEVALTQIVDWPDIPIRGRQLAQNRFPVLFCRNVGHSLDQFNTLSAAVVPARHR